MPALVLDAVKPVAGLSPAVRDRENADLVAELDKNHAVWETREHSATDIQVWRHIEETGKRCRAGGDQHQRTFELVEEFCR